MEDDDLKLFRGFADGRTDGRTNERTDICDCRVAYATEKSYLRKFVFQKFFLPIFDKLSVIYGDFFWPIYWWNQKAFCLSFPKWCNTYTFVEEIKALEYQTFSTHFLSKFMFF